MLYVNSHSYKSPHFVGILGSGMSALAQFLSWESLTVSGSDRALNTTVSKPVEEKLKKVGCTLYPQNGSGINDKTDIVVVSTAIEQTNPDIAEALKKNIPVVHRSDILKAIIDNYKTIAVAGTSGKSTVTSIIFHLAQTSGLSPSLITGANVKSLMDLGLIGNAFKGNSDLLIIEADESDGSLVKYSPYVSLFLNVSKDHNTVEDTISLFAQLKNNSKFTIKNNDDNNLNSIKSDLSFSLETPSDFRPDSWELNGECVILKKDGTTYNMHLPGKHNAQNLTSALSLCTFLNCEPRKLTNGINSYKGLHRRFNIYKASNNITVVDDFAHNPEKIKAAIITAKTMSKSVHAIFQPHGFGPTKFMRKELVETFKLHLQKNDTLTLLPIYYAGGTAQKDISSEDLAKDLSNFPFRVNTPKNKDDSITELLKITNPNDLILVMGARDPSLTDYVANILNSLRKKCL